MKIFTRLSYLVYDRCIQIRTKDTENLDSNLDSGGLESKGERFRVTYVEFILPEGILSLIHSIRTLSLTTTNSLSPVISMVDLGIASGHC